MYLWDTPTVPTKIRRTEFVQEVFNINRDYDHSVETAIVAVAIGDDFVNFVGPRILHVHNKYKTTNELVSQIYSLELAHTATVIAAKFNEDFGYCNINDAIRNMNNCYIGKMEWEICYTINFTVPRPSICSFIEKCLPLTEKSLCSIFWEIFLLICIKIKILNGDPRAVLLAITLLGRKNKLLAFKLAKTRYLYEIIDMIARECQVSETDAIKSFIEAKK